MIQSAVVLENEDLDLPDSYKVTVALIGAKTPFELELAGHKIVDKVFKVVGVNADKKPIYECVGVLATPYFEYETVDDYLGIIPLSSIQSLAFDKNYSHIVGLKEKKDRDDKRRQQNIDQAS